VINVSWNDAQEYVKALSVNNNRNLQCRLPSEAEWEYAARAGSTTQYSWGDAIGNNKANCDGCGSEWDNEKTASVGSFPKNAWGLQDMHGNAWEWVQDTWHANYKGAPDNGEAWEKVGDARRVLRGGSWFDSPGFLRSADRFDDFPVRRDDVIGFRVVCSPPSDR
jgi:formylglycine-generating enzyme required for sulfatase activity